MLNVEVAIGMLFIGDLCLKTLQEHKKSCFSVHKNEKKPQEKNKWQSLLKQGDRWGVKE